MTISDRDAFAHRGYQQAQDTAVRYAFAHRGEPYAVYFDGKDLSVRHANAVPPRCARCVCVARHHINDSVKLTFANHEKIVRFSAS